MTGHARASAQEYRDQVMAELAAKIDSALMRHEASPSPSLSPAELVSRMLAVVPTTVPENRMAEQVGPEFFDTTGVMVTLGVPSGAPISKQAVEHRRKRHSILALRTSDGMWIYPTWQFVGHAVLPGLSEVLAVFRDHESWSAATWLTSELDELDGATPRGWLLAGRDPGPLVVLAERTARRWAA